MTCPFTSYKVEYTEVSPFVWGKKEKSKVKILQLTFRRPPTKEVRHVNGKRNGQQQPLPALVRNESKYQRSYPIFLAETYNVFLFISLYYCSIELTASVAIALILELHLNITLLSQQTAAQKKCKLCDRTVTQQTELPSSKCTTPPLYLSAERKTMK